MGYKSGTGSILQAAKQDVRGTTKYPDTLINMTSEGINCTVTRESEGSLIGTKTEGERSTTSIKVEGSVSTILKSDFADFVFEQAMGVVTASGNQKTYTLADPGVDLPLATFVLRRGGKEVVGGVEQNWNINTYDDISISSLSIEAPAQQYVTADFNILGHKEIKANDAKEYVACGATEVAVANVKYFTKSGSIYTEDTSVQVGDVVNGKYKYSNWQDIRDNLAFTEKSSYKCTNATLTYGATPTTLDVETTTINIDNGMTEAPAVYSSGYYAEQPIIGQRAVTVSFNIPYGEAANTFRNVYYTAENPTNVQLKLKFTNSASASEYIEVTMPNVSITSGNRNVGGTELIDCSFEGVALSVGNTEPISVVVHHQA